MAIRKAHNGKKDVNTNQSYTYYFDIEKCKVCPFKAGCYKEGQKPKRILSRLNLQNIRNNEHFKKVHILKKRGENAIKLKRRIVNLRTDTGMMRHPPQVSLVCKCKER